MTLTPSLEQNVSDTVRRNPCTGVRAEAAVVGESQSSVHRVLKIEGLYPYYLQKVLSLLPTYYSVHVRFAWWYLDQCH
ncbi:hypothetical protein TNCV_3300701 [Trichonephila clavipes]|nr:hypothetical protein TNCV_3300701 [Trichonephila clavipes]